METALSTEFDKTRTSESSFSARLNASPHKVLICTSASSLYCFTSSVVSDFSFSKLFSKSFCTEEIAIDWISWALFFVPSTAILYVFSISVKSS